MQSMASVIAQVTAAPLQLQPSPHPERIPKELRALYNDRRMLGLDCWGPVININRDPRWGRHGEGPP
jgi:hypothetical protein